MNGSIWELAELAPYHDLWLARQREFKRRQAYYDGSVYERTLGGLGWLGPRAAMHVRPLYLPLARAVNVDAGIIPGDWKLAAPAAALTPARDQVLRWSGWAEDGVLYVHYGSVFGCSGLRIADLQAAKRVALSPINPLTYILLSGELYDATPELAVVCQDRLNVGGQFGDGETFEYGELFSRTEIRTFANGEPHGFDGRPAAYPNTLGEIPIVEVKHINNGGAIGDCAFEKVITLLDQVNELASSLAQVVHDNREPIYVITGAESSSLTREGGVTWFLPEGARVDILSPHVDIPGVLEFIRESRTQVEAGLVQLAFDQIAGRRQALAAETVKLQLLELALYVRRVRPNYDEGLVRALRMAGRAARLMGLANIAALDSDLLALDNERPVLPLAALGIDALPTTGGMNV